VSECTKIFPKGPGKTFSIFTKFFFKMGHFLRLLPSKELI